MRISPSRIILASGSVIRLEMLMNAGVEITVRVGNVDEDSIKKQGLAQNASFKKIAETLALAKAQEFPLQKNECVIGADQLLEFEGQIFDKPKSMYDARERLLAMRGKTHLLIGSAVIVQKGETPWVQTVVTKMHMRQFTESFLDAYLQREGEKILNSVGGYMFENGGAQLFSSVDGDFFAILGLSLLPLLERLREIGAIET